MNDRLPDLSPGAIRKAVLGASLQHPSVVYPAALGVVGGLGLLALGVSPLIAAAAAGSGAIAVLGLGANYLLRHDKLATDYVERLRRGLASQREAYIKDLAGDLNEVKQAEAGKQLQRFVDKLRTFEQVMGERMSPQELTYARFLAIAEEVFLAGLENLRAIHLAAISLRTVDEKYLGSRLKAIQHEPSDSTAVEQERNGVQAQLQQAEALKMRMRQCLAENELALAELDKATAAVGQMRTDPNRSMLNMEGAMAELARIAQRARELE